MKIINFVLNVSQDDEKTVNHGDVKTDENSSDNQYVCMKCGFENRPNVKFCTKCGNKLI